jgi:integrase
MKARREHRVPLSAPVLALLKALPRERDGFIFPGARKKGTPMSNMTMPRVLLRMGFDQITIHGFRSCFRDWCAERTNYANHIIEMALAHTIGDKVEAAYRRGDLFDKRRRLIDDWARYCVAPTAAAAVVPIRGARS